MKVVLGLLFFVALAGCATEDAPKSKEPPAQLTVYREPSTRDSLFPMLFSVDDRPLVQLQPEEKRSFEIEAGRHRFGYQLGLYNCSEEVQLESGKRYVYRLARGCVIEPEEPAP